MSEADYLRARKELLPGSPAFKSGSRRIDFRYKPPSAEAAAALRSHNDLAKQRRQASKILKR